MKFLPTSEQQQILSAGLIGLKVVACAGSGKTSTAVRRLFEMRKAMERSRSYAVLLSYSNVAVNTFREKFVELKAAENKAISDRVLITTVDSFITNNILLPHAMRVMGCPRRPFLVRGNERFLDNKSYSVFDGKRPVSPEDIDLRSTPAGGYEFFNKATRQTLPEDATIRAVKALAKSGAYTHASGRFWAALTLSNVPRLSVILARRFPFILVDEAQDIGSLHGEVLQQLETSGAVLGLIGDPSQAIYEFADADGSFLSDFKVATGGLTQPLTQNWRSVSEVVSVANRLTGHISSGVRSAPSRRHGAFYIHYDPTTLTALVATFSHMCVSNGYSHSEMAILARGTSMTYQLRGGKAELGTGCTKLFAEAALERDSRQDIATAFERCVDAILKLLELSDNTLRAEIVRGGHGDVAKRCRRIIWKFLRDPDNGLPVATLEGGAWHEKLKNRLPALFSSLKNDCGLNARASWKSNVTLKQLGVSQLYLNELDTGQGSDIRVSTVHKCKGESIGAVLYVTNSSSLSELLKGATSEEGRIGYVAVTRAMDLLVVAIPNSTKGEKILALESLGFRKWAIGA